MAAFSAGFKMGADMYDEADRASRAREDLAMRREKQARDMELLDTQIASSQRTNRLNQQLDEENAGIRSYIKNGSMTGNRSGFSDASAHQMFEQGGAGAVDEAASYGNVEARRMGLETPYQTGGVQSRGYDPANLEDQVGLNNRMMSVAALKGDHQTMLQLQDKSKELGETKVFNDAVQQFSINPDSFTEYNRWVNKNNPMITVAPAKDPRTGMLTGYNIMTVGPAGDATHKFLSPAQAAQLAGATALMRVNPTKALALIGQVDQNMAASITALNAANEKVGTSNNQAVHFANEDTVGLENAQSHRITANAQAAMVGVARDKANQEKPVKQTKSQVMQEEIDAYSGILRRQDPKLTKEDADRKAADIVLKNPNAKETPDVGLAEAGLMRIQGKLYRQGKGGKLENVEVPGESKLDQALKAFQANGGNPPGGPAKQEVAGRPFYNTPTPQLQQIAKKPRGVSSGDAAAAADELTRRQNEPRLGGF